MDQLEKKYIVGPKLGSGTFGQVYAGIRRKDTKEVALKYIPNRHIKHWVSESDSKETRMPREVQMLTTLEGTKGVVELVDYMDLHYGYMIIMNRPKLCQDLFTFLNAHGPLDEVLAAHLFQQIVEAVVKCRKVEILHNDLKEENIMINLADYSTFIVDFGAATTGELTSQSILGTKEYTPPEFFECGEYSLNQATVWSLGVMLYAMTHAALPCTGKGAKDSHNVSFGRHIGANCRDLIKQCLEPSPVFRITLGGILFHPWLYTLERECDYPSPISFPSKWGPHWTGEARRRHRRQQPNLDTSRVEVDEVDSLKRVVD